LGTQADEVSARELILRYGAVAAVTVAAGVLVRKRGVY
jgi:hypothetical protein